jgi:hypothetical protein
MKCAHDDVVIISLIVVLWLSTKNTDVTCNPRCLSPVLEWDLGTATKALESVKIVMWDACDAFYNSDPTHDHVDLILERLSYILS